MHSPACVSSDLLSPIALSSKLRRAEGQPESPAASRARVRNEMTRSGESCCALVVAVSFSIPSCELWKLNGNEVVEYETC